MHKPTPKENQPLETSQGESLILKRKKRRNAARKGW